MTMKKGKKPNFVKKSRSVLGLWLIWRVFDIFQQKENWIMGLKPSLFTRQADNFWTVPSGYHRWIKKCLKRANENLTAFILGIMDDRGDKRDRRTTINKNEGREEADLRVLNAFPNL